MSLLNASKRRLDRGRLLLIYSVVNEVVRSVEEEFTDAAVFYERLKGSNTEGFINDLTDHLFGVLCGVGLKNLKGGI